MSTNWIEEITKERARQDAQWGGPEHDDTHSEADWEEYITGHGYALTAYDHELLEVRPADDYRKRLVKIAALAVAAMESYDRKQEDDDDTR